MQLNEALLIARRSAYNHRTDHAYLPKSSVEVSAFQPHAWVLEAICQAAKVAVRQPDPTDFTGQLPKVPLHPDPQNHTWTSLEERAIEDFGHLSFLWGVVSAHTNGVKPNANHFVAAVRTLNCLGYHYDGGEEWKPPLGQPPAHLTKAEPAVATAENVHPIAKASAVIGEETLRHLNEVKVRSLREAFEQWYVENTYDLKAEPVGSRAFTLQWLAYRAGHETRNL